MKWWSLIQISFLLAVSSIQLSAQDSREIQFSVYAQYPVRGVAFNPVSEAAITAGAKAAQPILIETHSQSRAGKHSFIGSNEIQFFNATTQTLVGKARFAEHSNKWLFIFIRNPRHKENPQAHLEYLIYAFDDREQNLPSDHLVFLNISGKQLNGSLGNQTIQLGPGESESYRIKESLSINLWTRASADKKPLPALIKAYTPQPNHRYLLILFPPALRGSADLDTRFLNESLIIHKPDRS